MREQMGYQRRIEPVIAACVAFAFFAASAWSATGEEVQARVTADLAAGRPIVVHVVVVLCDNGNQGIVPVPKELGNGQDPSSNLYWGALYGLRTHLARSSEWQRLSTSKTSDERILERSVFFAEVSRKETDVSVYIVADAWDGSQIKPAIQRFLIWLRGPTPRPSG
jgi:hypothetical protein